MPKKKPRQQKKKKLKAEKRPLEDLPLKENQVPDVKGGFAPPYTPVGPNREA